MTADLTITPDRIVQAVLCVTVVASVGLEVLGLWKLCELIFG